MRPTDDQIIQDGNPLNYTLFAVPMTVAFDSTNLASPLEDPHRGIRASLSVSSYLCAGPSPMPGSSSVRSRWPVTSTWTTSCPPVPAAACLPPVRLAGLAEGAGQFSLPPDQRFYAGGSETVRGYAYQSVGPKFPPGSPAAGQPIGGTAITAGSLEFRQRFGTNLGAAVFVDAGQVSASLHAVPQEFRIGAGAGMRYFTPIGPIRLDVAVPIPRHRSMTVATGGTPPTAIIPADDAFEIYIGLGQAF